MEIDPASRVYRTDSADSGFSIAGMQPKAALRRTADGGWAVPHGSLPTTHLIKASRSLRWPHEALIEHLTMRTAAGCGIPASRTAQPPAVPPLRSTTRTSRRITSPTHLSSGRRQ